jgi:hypothetical protein
MTFANKVARIALYTFAAIGVVATVLFIAGLILDVQAFDRTSGGYEPPYTDFAGEPIANAEVLVIGMSPVTSGPDGRFSIPGVQAPYDIAFIVRNEDGEFEARGRIDYVFVRRGDHGERSPVGDAQQGDIPCGESGLVQGDHRAH